MRLKPAAVGILPSAATTGIRHIDIAIHATGDNISIFCLTHLHLNHFIGNITINTDGKTEVNAMQDITVTSKMGNVLIDGTVGMVQLGRNPAKQFVNNLPVCPVTGMPHYVGNTNVQC